MRHTRHTDNATNNLRAHLSDQSPRCLAHALTTNVRNDYQNDTNLNLNCLQNHNNQITLLAPVCNVVTEASDLAFPVELEFIKKLFVTCQLHKRT